MGRALVPMEKPVHYLAKGQLNGNGTRLLAMQLSTGARALGPFAKSAWVKIVQPLLEQAQSQQQQQQQQQLLQPQPFRSQTTVFQTTVQLIPHATF